MSYTDDEWDDEFKKCFEKPDTEGMTYDEINIVVDNLWSTLQHAKSEMYLLSGRLDREKQRNCSYLASPTCSDATVLGMTKTQVALPVTADVKLSKHVLRCRVSLYDSKDIGFHFRHFTSKPVNKNDVTEYLESLFSDMKRVLQNKLLYTITTTEQD